MSQVLHAPRTSERVDVPGRISMRTSGVRLFAAYWGSLALVDVNGHAIVLGVASLAAWAAVCSVGQRLLVAASIGTVAWCFLTGFVVNSYGDLEVHTVPDLAWWATLTAPALVAAGLTRLVRR